MVPWRAMGLRSSSTNGRYITTALARTDCRLLPNPANRFEYQTVTYLRINPINRSHWQIIFAPTNHPVCEIWNDIDGFWKVAAESFGNGFIEPYIIREIADILDELNAPYEAKLKEYFESHPPEPDNRIFDENSAF